MAEEPPPVRQDVTVPNAAPYERVLAALRADIQAGVYPVGEYLPGQRQLASRYQVAYNTVGQALRLLATEGLIDSLPRRGNLVLAAGSVLELVLDDDGRITPATGSAEMGPVKVSVVRPPSAVARLLGVGDDEAPVTVRECVLRTGDLSWALRRLYLPAPVVAQVPDLDRAGQVDEHELLARHGLAEDGHRTVIGPVLDKEVGQILGAASAQLLELARISYRAGTVLYCELVLVRADRARLSQSAGAAPPPGSQAL